MKLFVVSDIHSFYKPLIEALDEAGFDKNNKDHWLISCGDLFDRGNESEEVLHYIMSLDRKVLVKGNHDILLKDCCARGYYFNHDVSNGTTKTIMDIGGAANGYSFDKCCDYTYMKTEAYRGLLVNYFETKSYIFVHSWIPTTKVHKDHPADKWIPLTTDAYMEDWRQASEADWEAAMWGNPFCKAQDKMNKTGKTIIFGHWHCSFGHSCDSHGELSEFGDNAKWDPYYNEEQGIIGIDRCTAHTGEVNVLVLEDDFLES